MYDEYGNFYDDEIPVSNFARSFGFDSDAEFNNHCDAMEEGMDHDV